MKFKNYLMMFALFFVLMCSAGAVFAASNDTAQNIASEIDFDNSVSLSNDNDSIELNAEESGDNAAEDNLGIAMSHDDSLSYGLNSSTDDKLNGAVSSKSDLKIVNYTNFVKKGKTYCFNRRTKNTKRKSRWHQTTT